MISIIVNMSQVDVKVLRVNGLSDNKDSVYSEECQRFPHQPSYETDAYATQHHVPVYNE